MGYLRGTVLTVGALALLAGCASQRDCGERCAQSAPVVIHEARPVELASALLFDPRPGMYDPQEFAYRSDWPSTPTFYSPGQMIYFSERTVDYQGRGFNTWLGPYRRAETVRFGYGYQP